MDYENREPQLALSIDLLRDLEIRNLQPDIRNSYWLAHHAGPSRESRRRGERSLFESDRRNHYLEETSERLKLARTSMGGECDRIKASIEAAFKQAARGVALISCTIEVSSRSDWMQKWKEGFELLRSGDACCRTVVETAGKGEAESGLKSIRAWPLAPETHETTRLCWKQSNANGMAAVYWNRDRDWILAIARRCLRLVREWAIDVDPQAIESRERTSRSMVSASVVLIEGGRSIMRVSHLT